MGHPKSVKVRRSLQIHIRVTPAEKAKLAVAAHRSKFEGDISAWALDLLLRDADALGVTDADVQAETAALEDAVEAKAGEVMAKAAEQRAAADSRAAAKREALKKRKKGPRTALSPAPKADTTARPKE